MGQFRSTGTVDVYFFPNGGATVAIVRELDVAKREILVQAYSFTSKPIAKALIDAKNRGVKVVVVLDKASVGRSIHPLDVARLVA